MTNRKNYNSILFLTVYLGLVLVGGSSQVFAHAASNALFELRNEIEFKEDLDNKPENDEFDCSKLKAKTSNVDNTFIEDYATYVHYLLKNHDFVNEKYLNLNVSSSLLDTYFPNIRKDLKNDYADIRLGEKSFYGNFYFKSKSESRNLAPATIAYNASLQFQICRNQNNPKKVIYENTTALFSNNQVFIVTRLPRAAIDSLLK